MSIYSPSKEKASPIVNPPLSEAAAANLRTGLLLLCKEALVTAIQDRRLHRGHLRVLAGIAYFMNSTTAKAWPSREAIAAFTGLSVKAVWNLLNELRGFGYLISAKETVPEAENRRLKVYTFGNIDHETIRQSIADFVDAMRHVRNSQIPAPTGIPVPAGVSTQEFPSQREKNSRPGGNSNSLSKEQKKDDDNSSSRGKVADATKVADNGGDINPQVALVRVSSQEDWTPPSCIDNWCDLVATWGRTEDRDFCATWLLNAAKALRRDFADEVVRAAVEETVLGMVTMPKRPGANNPFTYFMRSVRPLAEQMADRKAAGAQVRSQTNGGPAQQRRPAKRSLTQVLDDLYGDKQNERDR